ncbi:MAG TPA: flagellar FliJ family protein [Actinomycetota bacterium]
MRRRDPVAAITKLRGFKEREARTGMGLAMRKEAEARQALLERRRAYDARPVPQGPLSALEIRTFHLQGIRSSEQIAEAAEALEGSRLGAEEARREWTVASDRLKAAERLQQKRREELARIAQAAAMRSLDELAVMMRERDQWS